MTTGFICFSFNVKLKILAINFLCDKAICIKVLETIKIYCHHLTTLTKGLRTTNSAKTMVNLFFIKLIGGQFIFSRS
jgi:hypothetical protein